LANVKLGDVDGVEEALEEALNPILSDESIFAVNLYEVGLADKVKAMFLEMMKGKGAVRGTLKKYLN
jgi:fructuronate reductase